MEKFATPSRHPRDTLREIRYDQQVVSRRIGSRLAVVLVGTGATACTVLAAPGVAGALAVPQVIDASDLGGVSPGLTGASDVGLRDGVRAIDLTVDGESGLQAESGDAAALATAGVDADVAGVVGVDVTAAVGTGSLDLSAAMGAAGQTLTATVGAGTDGVAAVAGAGDAGLEVGVGPTGAGIDLGLGAAQASGPVFPGAALTGANADGGKGSGVRVTMLEPIGAFTSVGDGSGIRSSSGAIASGGEAGTPRRVPGMRLTSALGQIEVDGADAANHSLLVFLAGLGGEVLPALLLLLAVVVLRRHSVTGLQARRRDAVSMSPGGTAVTA